MYKANSLLLWLSTSKYTERNESDQKAVWGYLYARKAFLIYDAAVEEKLIDQWACSCSEMSASTGENQVREVLYLQRGSSEEML